MSFGIRPLGDRVVVERIKAEDKTSSGFILTGQPKELPHMATVVAVGPGTEETKMEVKIGDTVIFSQYSGTPVEYDGDDYIIISHKDILAIVE